MKTVHITDIEQIEAIIKECQVCYVGLADLEGIPYVLPMNFGYKDNTVYLHSAPTGKSLEILEGNNNICLTFSTDHSLVFQHPKVACSYRVKSKSVVAWGKVIFEDNFESKIEALNIIMSQYSNQDFEYSTPAINNVKIWKINLDKISCKAFGEPHQAIK
ncbi:MFS transporter [Bacteroidales bacterium]|nr:MFS transporter [Bacteroidales bacterium]